MSTYEKYCYDITLKPDIQLITDAYTYRHKSSSVLIFLARCQQYLLINNFLCQRDGKCVDNVLQMHTNWKVFQTVFLKHMFFVLFILEWSGWDFSADRIDTEYFDTVFRSSWLLQEVLRNRIQECKAKKPETLLGKSIDRWRDYSTVIQWSLVNGLTRSLVICGKAFFLTHNFAWRWSACNMNFYSVLSRDILLRIFILGE